MINFGNGTFDFVSNVSGTQNVISGESTGAQYQNAPIDELRKILGQGSVTTRSTVADFVAYISGGNVTVADAVSNKIIVSGTAAATVLQSGINGMAQGQVMLIREGFYQLGASLLVPGKLTIIGEPGGWNSNGTQLQPTTNTPAMTLSGSNSVVTRDLYFQPSTSLSGTYSAGLFRITGNSTGNQIRDLSFFDQAIGMLSGCAIQLDNGGITNGPSVNFFEDIFINGFNCNIKVNVSGGASPFINNNVFSNHDWAAVGTHGVQINSAVGAVFNGNMFYNVQSDSAGGGNPTTSVFDFATNVSGNIFYNKQIGCVISDLPATGVYATVKAGIEVDMVACTGDQLISGTGKLRHYSVYTDDRSTFSVTSSGVGTTSWFVSYNTLSPNQAPSLVSVTAVNSGTASAGAPFLTNINISGFTINTPNAVNSGVALSWNWHANL